MSTDLPRVIHNRVRVTGAPKAPNDVVRLGDMEAAIAAATGGGSIAGALCGPPDWENANTTNRISTNGGSWTADAAGYVNVGGNVWTADGKWETVEIEASINDVVVVRDGGFRNAGGCHTLEVAAGDEIKVVARNADTAENVAVGDISCHFVPAIPFVPPVPALPEEPPLELALTPPDDLAAAPAVGVAETAARADHVHRLPIATGREDLDVGVSALAKGEIYLSTANDALKLYVGDDSGRAVLLRELPANPPDSPAAVADTPRGAAIADVVVGGPDGNYEETFVFCLTQNGKVYSFGSNARGQLGRAAADGTQAVFLPEEIPGLSNVVQIAVGNYTAFFLTEDGKVYSCGANSNGELGRVVATGSATASNLGEITGLPPVARIVARSATTYFITTAGTVYVCGYDDGALTGRVALPADESVSNLGEIPGLAGVAQIAVIENNVAYFLTTYGTVYSCGFNASGQLGRDAGDYDYETPNLGEIPGLSDVSRIVVATTAIIAYFITTTGAVYSCGQNYYGQLGRATPDNPAGPNLGVIPDLPPVSEILLPSQSDPSAYDDFVYFLTTTGRVYSCGKNSSNQLGRSVQDGSESVCNLGEITDLPDVRQVVLRSEGAYFITVDNTPLVCGNSGLEGYSYYANYSIRSARFPNGTTIPEATRVVICGNIFFILALNGPIYSFGDTYGACGSGADTHVVNGLPATVTKIVSREYSTFFLTAAGAVYSCGCNNSGQLGRIAGSGDYRHTNLGKIKFA